MNPISWAQVAFDLVCTLNIVLLVMHVRRLQKRLDARD